MKDRLVELFSSFRASRVLKRITAAAILPALWMPTPTYASLSVFLDCKKGSCDREFIKRELPFIDFVRDRKDSSVHVIVTRQRTAGGRLHELIFYSSEKPQASDYQLSSASLNTDTKDQVRRSVLEKLKLGLTPYLLTTNVADSLSVSFDAIEQKNAPQARVEKDPWNGWVFRSEIGGKMEKEDSREEEEHWGNFSSSRVTDDWRLGFGVGQRKKTRTFELDDGSTLVDETVNQYLSSQVIKSLSPKWSVGLAFTSGQSSFNNIDRGNRLAMATEYNLFPYSLSAEKALTFGYYVSINQFRYDQVTIFGLEEETLGNHGAFADFDFEQPWGNLSVGLYSAMMMDDPSLYRVTLDGYLRYRLARGLSVRLWGESALVKDQIYLANANASTSDILLGSSALDTDSKTKFGLSLEYTFGSAFSSIVNTRLQDSGFGRFPFD